VKELKISEIKRHEDYPVRNSFIVFELRKSRDGILKKYGKWETLAGYLRCLLCCLKFLVNPKMFHSDEL
jgi:hypothetical protein